VRETVALFVLPPLVTFALVALSLLIFTSHLTRESLETTFVAGNARRAGAAWVHERSLAPAARAVRSTR
jgi:hypothetical protein